MDNERLRMPRPCWQRAGMALASVVLAGLLVASATGGTVLRAWHAPLPNIARQLGPLRLVAHETVLPQCAFGMPCATPLHSFEPKAQHYYVVWVMVRWPGSQIRIHRLLAQPLSG